MIDDLQCRLLDDPIYDLIYHQCNVMCSHLSNVSTPCMHQILYIVEISAIQPQQYVVTIYCLNFIC